MVLHNFHIKINTIEVKMVMKCRMQMIEQEIFVSM